MTDRLAELITDDPEWDFWDQVGLPCVGYNAQIDYDALGVLKGIVAGKSCGPIAAELDLPEQYVELLQSIFCSVDWAEYGTSPRGCWVAPEKNGAALVEAFERHIATAWGER